MDHSNTFLSRKLILSFKVLEVKKETMSGLMSILSVVVLVFIGWRGDRQTFENIGQKVELVRESTVHFSEAEIFSTNCW